MTTSLSPLKALKAQANHIAEMLKRFERGEKIDVRFAEKLEAARARESFKFAVVMDDKTVIIEMPWTVMRDTTQDALEEYIVDQMRGSRDIPN